MDRATRFVERLTKTDRRGLAALRRSLGFPPGEFPEAYPYVEPFVSEEGDRWAFYLLAGLFALAGGTRAGRIQTQDEDARGESLGRAVRSLFLARDSSPSIEQRFIALLDAEAEQLPHRLRQMASLLNADSIAVDWAQLLRDLQHWGSGHRWIQQRWARDYYRSEATEDIENRGGQNDE